MLDEEQIHFFKTQGYLIIPGAMDAALCRRVRDLMWQALPPNTRLQANDPASFVGPFSEQDQSSDERHMRADYRWLNRFLGVNAGRYSTDLFRIHLPDGSAAFGRPVASGGC